MTDFLLFTLYAPLASWGDIAVGETRGSWDRPSRSAIVGMLGAALGVARDDRAQQDALSSGYGMAVRLDAPGVILSDYHTTQTLAASLVKKRRPSTRAQLLESRDRETILSRRTYRADALCTVAVWAREEAQWTLNQLVSALRTPAFVLYAGRKANALGLPTDPTVVLAESLREAFEGRSMIRKKLSFPVSRFAWSRAPEISYDADSHIVTGFVVQRREVRRDTSPDRDRWQFSERVVEVAQVDGGGDDRV